MNFTKNKQSNTIVIYGCGNSINDLTTKEIEKLSKYDSIGFNWFCFSHIPTTYYLVREQCNIPKRVHGEENIDNFYNLINKYYKQSCLIIHDLSNHSPNAYDYSDIKNIKRFNNNNYIIVKDVKLEGNDPGVERWRKESIFKVGIIHGKCTLTNALHFSIWMGYENIIFVGVDLYNSQYFWLNNKTRYSVKNKNKDKDSIHSTYTSVIFLIKNIRKYYPEINMYNYSEKSLLTQFFNVEK